MFIRGPCHTPLVFPTPVLNVWLTRKRSQQRSIGSICFQCNSHNLCSIFKIKINGYTSDHRTYCERKHFGVAFTATPAPWLLLAAWTLPWDPPGEAGGGADGPLCSMSTLGRSSGPWRIGQWCGLLAENTCVLFSSVACCPGGLSTIIW